MNSFFALITWIECYHIFLHINNHIFGKKANFLSQSCHLTLLIQSLVLSHFVFSTKRTKWRTRFQFRSKNPLQERRIIFPFWSTCTAFFLFLLFSMWFLVLPPALWLVWFYFPFIPNFPQAFFHKWVFLIFLSDIA